ncbi:X-ray radiation resistance-associated protein 1 isoform X3 [Mesoplodon densirostris]|uniref:X-ray radiation resistance-associated protein 1 isoform X3 n=1 Tax=Mesoplodon densirostris TaxID=48708 RepID=UPI0028DBADC1|nr:X-ray radiation resistance-associated protein 1 isoform X3 [Mesoplodon densirostris]
MASSGVYKLDDGKPYLSNCFPAKSLLRMPEEGRGHWLVTRKCSLKKKPRGVVEARAEGQESQKVSFEIGGKKGSRQENQMDTPGHVLDQAFLLKHHCVKNPSDLCNINVSGLKFSKAKEKDFKHFNSVIYINASENLLPLEAFHTFPVLKELELAFNGIKTVYVKYGDFKSLEFLDLSFNSLTAEAICDLGILPHLRVLLLTGNGLTSLPPNLAVAEQEAYVTSPTSKRYILRFPALETLMLDDNKLSNPSCFASLAGLRRLKKLSLDQNKIFRIPYLQQVQLRDGSGEWVGGRGSPRKEPQSMLQPKSWIFEALDDQPDYTVLPMKKDVDQTEVVFSSYPGFSASETTKVCALPPIFEILPVKSLKARNQTLALPFPELRYLSLAYNKIAKEDAILPVALFPSLCELIFHNNPLVAHTRGVPPLLKSFLQERLGIHLIRRKMVKAKHHILMPRKDSRKVSGLSSSTFQRDDTEIKEKDQRPPPAAPREVKRTQKKLPSGSFSRKYHGSVELLTAKPDPAFNEPKGIQKNTQALQHMLKHPLVYCSCKPRLDTLQKHYVPKEKRTQRIPIPPPRKTRAQLLDDILICMRDPRNITEAPLGAVLCQQTEQRLVNQKQYLEAKRLLKEFRAQYRRLVRCSLRSVFGATAPPHVPPALSEGQPKKFSRFLELGRFLEFMDEFCQEPTASDSKG